MENENKQVAVFQGGNDSQDVSLEAATKTHQTLLPNDSRIALPVTEFKATVSAASKSVCHFYGRIDKHIVHPIETWVHVFYSKDGDHQYLKIKEQVTREIQRQKSVCHLYCRIDKHIVHPIETWVHVFYSKDGDHQYLKIKEQVTREIQRQGEGKNLERPSLVVMAMLHRLKVVVEIMEKACNMSMLVSEFVEKVAKDEKELSIYDRQPSAGLHLMRCAAAYPRIWNGMLLLPEASKNTGTLAKIVTIVETEKDWLEERVYDTARLTGLLLQALAGVISAIKDPKQAWHDQIKCLNTSEYKVELLMRKLPGFYVNRGSFLYKELVGVTILHQQERSESSKDQVMQLMPIRRPSSSPESFAVGTGTH